VVHLRRDCSIFGRNTNHFRAGVAVGQKKKERDEMSAYVRATEIRGQQQRQTESRLCVPSLMTTFGARPPYSHGVHHPAAE